MSAETISPQALFALLGTAHAPTVIDVRGVEEYAAGHIPGVLHIPGDTLESRLGEIPRDSMVVPY